MSDPWLQAAALVSVVAPALAFTTLAAFSWFSRFPAERTIVRLVAGTFTLVTLASLGATAEMFRTGLDEVRVPLGHWFEIAHYGFALELVFDRLSIPFVTFGAMLVGVIAAFSARYLHRERGFGRFYLLLVLFGAGVELVVLAGSLDLVFFGWELVGLSSALLIAFFDDRVAPVRHGMRAFLTYRLCDIGLLTAAVWLHHTTGSAAIAHNTTGAWDGLAVPPTLADATIVGLLLLFATMGKSAQVPFGGWLPRAMEGPTPSSAIFYGALSIHLGPYLLLRAAPILERSPVAAMAVVLVGALTAGHATLVGRVQTDIKSALAYASMTQVGLIFIEIGLGLRFVALAHIVGHASIRTLELLRAPSLLHDHHHLEQAMGGHLPRTGGHLERLFPERFRKWLYLHALERGYFDTLLRDYVLGGALSLLRGLDRAEERWLALLGGERAKRSATTQPSEVRR